MKQINDMRDFFKSKYKDMPVFVAGDYNDTPESASIDLMETSFVDLCQRVHYKSSNPESVESKRNYPQFTFLVPGKKRCLDYIFLHRNRFELTNDILIEKMTLPKQ